MKMEVLTTENVYTSAAAKASLVGRLSPGLGFYSRMIRIVLSSARLSRKGKYHGEEWVHYSLRIVKALESVGARIQVENFDAFRNMDKPCVFISNHMSTLETFVLPGIIRPYRRVSFIVKKELIEYPVFKHVMISTDPIVVSRDNPRADLTAVLRGGKERLERGVSIIVFPQTTRRAHTRLEKFNTIGIKLARHACVPIIPIAVRSDAWGNGKWIKDFGKIDPQKPIHFCFGESMEIEGTGKDEHQSIISFINGKLSQWYEETG